MSQTEGLREVPYLSTGQVAEILGITKKTLKNWLKASLIPEPQAQSDEPVPALDTAGYREHPADLRKGIGR